MNKRVFVDMDGVLCEYRPQDSVEDMQRAGYFRGLLPRRQMVDAVSELVDSCDVDVFILSAVFKQTKSASIAEKNEWLNEYLPVIDMNHRIFTVCGEDKAAAVNGISSTDILCDDYSRNLNMWVNAGGQGIKILNGVNGTNKTYVAGPRVDIVSRGQLADLIRAM